MQRGIRLHINKDVVAGLMFMAWGVAGLWLARTYPVGTAMRMGPGYFPNVLGWLLLVFGLGITVRGALTEGEKLAAWYWRPLAMVLLSFIVFAALIDRAGLASAAAAASSAPTADPSFAGAKSCCLRSASLPGRSHCSATHSVCRCRSGPSVVDLKFLPWLPQTRLGTSNPKPH
jgi:hypothetical protein